MKWKHERNFLRWKTFPSNLFLFSEFQKHELITSPDCNNTQQTSLFLSFCAVLKYLLSSQASLEAGELFPPTRRKGESRTRKKYKSSQPWIKKWRFLLYLLFIVAAKFLIIDVTVVVRSLLSMKAESCNALDVAHLEATCFDSWNIYCASSSPTRLVLSRANLKFDPNVASTLHLVDKSTWVTLQQEKIWFIYTSCTLLTSFFREWGRKLN